MVPLELGVVVIVPLLETNLARCGFRV